MTEKTEKIFKRILSESFARNEKLTRYLPLTIKSWKDVALSEALISAITNNPMIANFPTDLQNDDIFRFFLKLNVSNSQRPNIPLQWN